MSIDRKPMEFGPESPQIGIDSVRDLMPSAALPQPVALDRSFIDAQRALNEVQTPEQRGSVGRLIGNLAPVLSQRLKVNGFDATMRHSLQGYMPTEAVNRLEAGSMLPVANHMGSFMASFGNKDPKVAAKVLEALVARAVMSVNAQPDTFDVQAIVRELSAAQTTLDSLRADSGLLAELIDVDTGDRFPSVGVKVQKRDGKSQSLTILPVPILDHGDGVVAYRDPKVERRPNSRFMREGNSVLLGVGFTDNTVVSNDNIIGLADEVKPLLKQPRKRLWLTSGLTVREVSDEEAILPVSDGEKDRAVGAAALRQAGLQTAQRDVGVNPRPLIVPEHSVGALWFKGRAGEIDAVVPQADLSREAGALKETIRVQERANRQGVEVDPVTASLIGRAIASSNERTAGNQQHPQV